MFLQRPRSLLQYECPAVRVHKHVQPFDPNVLVFDEKIAMFYISRRRKKKDGAVLERGSSLINLKLTRS